MREVSPFRVIACVAANAVSPARAWSSLKGVFVQYGMVVFVVLLGIYEM